MLMLFQLSFFNDLNGTISTCCIMSRPTHHWSHIFAHLFPKFILFINILHVMQALNIFLVEIFKLYIFQILKSLIAF